MVTGEETKAAEKLGGNYEMVIIVSPDVADEGLEPVIEGLSQFIAGKGGEVIEVIRWGKKKLAYPIKHAMEGNYVLFRLKLNPTANKELENNLKISEKIMRFLLIKLDL
jgi:small subunit ribosomal protein S6